MPFGRWWPARGRGYCRGKSDLSGEYAPDSARAKGSSIFDEPEDVRESKARTGMFLGEKLISDHCLFSSYEGRLGAANGKDSWGVFQGCTGLGRLDVGSRAGFNSSRPPPLWTSVFQFSFFLYYVLLLLLLLLSSHLFWTSDYTYQNI